MRTLNLYPVGQKCEWLATGIWSENSLVEKSDLHQNFIVVNMCKAFRVVPDPE